jgi:hypothetical protein
MGSVQYRTSCQMRRCTSGQRASVAWRKAIRYSSVTTGKWYSFILAFLRHQRPYLGFFLAEVAQAAHQEKYALVHPKVPF